MNAVLENLHAYIEMARDEGAQSDNSSVRARDWVIVRLAAEIERLDRIAPSADGWYPDDAHDLVSHKLAEALAEIARLEEGTLNLARQIILRDSNVKLLETMNDLLLARMKEREAENAAMRDVLALHEAAYKRAAADWQAERGNTAVFPDLAELLVWDAKRQADAALGKAVTL